MTFTEAVEELGVRVALALFDEDQVWWELEHLQYREEPSLLDKWRSQVDVYLHQ